MLRLPQFDLRRPTTATEAVALLSEHEGSMILAGGTDLLPNMKHELFTPSVVVSLEDVSELRGIRAEADGTLRIGAMTRIADVASSELVQAAAPALAQATSLIAGPQLRTMGTLGGNVMLDTRCQWYNQTYFWREALGFCLKKDGSACHVVGGGAKCVAAASNDSVPPLMTLGASLVIESQAGRREMQADDFWRADGIWNKKLQPNELLVEIVVPPRPTGITHRGAYGKLRDRGSIDYPLLGIGVRLDLDAAGRIVQDADMVVTALAARPLRVKDAKSHLSGVDVTDEERWAAAVEEAAQAAYKRCHPMPNIPGDHEYRREMVPVYARRTLFAAAQDSGPVHHV